MARGSDEEGTKSFDPVAKYRVVLAPSKKTASPRTPSTVAEMRWERRDTVMPQEQRKPHNPFARWKDTAAMPST
jgi:hypothetical protein